VIRAGGEQTAAQRLVIVNLSGCWCCCRVVVGGGWWLFGGHAEVPIPPRFGIRGFRPWPGGGFCFTPNDLWVVLVVLAVMIGLALPCSGGTPLGLKKMRSGAFSAPEVGGGLLGVRVGADGSPSAWALAGLRSASFGRGVC